MECPGVLDGIAAVARKRHPAWSTGGWLCSYRSEGHCRKRRAHDHCGEPDRWRSARGAGHRVGSPEEAIGSHPWRSGIVVHGAAGDLLCRNAPFPGGDGGSVIRTLVVDDVALARDRLVRFLASEPDVLVVGEAATLEAALARARLGDVDLVLLDIGLPDGSGLDLVRHLETLVPHVVFVTAYSVHAVRAFDAGALDYLLKPVDPKRLQLAIRRVRQRIDGKGAQTARLAVDVGDRTVYLAPAQIDYVEVAGHYVCIHAGKDTYLRRDSLANLADCLEPHGFVRIHRSSLVNVTRVVALRPARNQDAQLELLGGATLRVSRQFRGQLQARLPTLSQPLLHD
ncbi:response regulator transcription factor [Xanthomonas sp. CPBF 426]|nr:response regulator transcription factor [Xanthomonas sp. CPBF 426]CAG2087039.1 response regulator transcription factor [Xanthomonas euroxanthea]